MIVVCRCAELDKTLADLLQYETFTDVGESDTQVMVNMFDPTRAGLLFI